MKIDFRPIRMTHQKPTDVRECSIELNDDHLVYIVDFDSQAAPDDPMMPWIDETTWNMCTVLKRDISGVDIYYSEIGKHYKVTVATLISEIDSIGMYFSLKNKEGAIEVYDQIVKWLLDK